MFCVSVFRLDPKSEFSVHMQFHLRHFFLIASLQQISVYIGIVASDSARQMRKIATAIGVTSFEIALQVISAKLVQ
jgi:hypothetical protein